MGGKYGFSRSRKGVLRLRLDEIERGLLLSLAQQIADFVAPAPSDPDADPLAAFVGIDAVAEVPDDPALARLLPDAYRDDEEASREFRRFTERGLRESKMAGALVVAGALAEASDEVVIPADQVGAWLGFLNDTRLALGTRLEITEDAHDELAALPDDDPRSGLFHVYDWLTYLQDTLVRLLMP
jgi:hypothetical protein